MIPMQTNSERQVTGNEQLIHTYSIVKCMIKLIILLINDKRTVDKSLVITTLNFSNKQKLLVIRQITLKYTELNDCEAMPKIFSKVCHKSTLFTIHTFTNLFCQIISSMSFRNRIVSRCSAEKFSVSLSLITSFKLST